MKESKYMSNDNIEREFLKKAEKVTQDYNQATGFCICIYDGALLPYFPEGAGDFPEKTICLHCKRCLPEQTALPCHEMHKNAIIEASKKGNIHFYQCSMNFLFWTSPIYTDGNFSGAVRGGGLLVERQKTVDILSNANDTFVMCNSEISREEEKKRANLTAGVDREKAQSLAEMMQLCAESLSSGNEDYHEIIRRRAEQQETIDKLIGELKKQHPENAGKPGYPLHKEKALFAALRKGDTSEAKKILNELLAMLFYSYPGQFKYVQLRVTELVVLISRVELSPAKSGNLSMEINSQNLKLVQEAKTIEELTDIIHTVVDRVSGTIFSFRGIPHAAALRKAENFILENYTRKISLKEIADIAGLSPPYFSTIFKEEMGENLSKYLNRLRVEKASRLLLETDMSLSEIAACCCFEDQSWFSKIFKSYTGISPGKYRNQGGGVAFKQT
ncbi:MAG: helix-turn-helix domain-containing protein [Treponema sp.]|jgi:AraC-like DNA-binding protein/ligand-binding sensor protein|nr:helix-turn-helix domain-containing protein [Treponema sp.]